MLFSCPSHATEKCPPLLEFEPSFTPQQDLCPHPSEAFPDQRVSSMFLLFQNVSCAQSVQMPPAQYSGTMGHIKYGTTQHC